MLKILLISLVFFSTQASASYGSFNKNNFLKELNNITTKKNATEICGIGDFYNVNKAGTNNNYELKHNYNIDKFLSLKCKKELQSIVDKYDYFEKTITNYKQHFEVNDLDQVKNFIHKYTFAVKQRVRQEKLNYYLKMY
jgi:hypothetical protein